MLDAKSSAGAQDRIATAEPVLPRSVPLSNARQKDVAVGMGFEPTEDATPHTDYKSGALNHSATPPTTDVGRRQKIASPARSLKFSVVNKNCIDLQRYRIPCKAIRTSASIFRQIILPQSN